MSLILAGAADSSTGALLDQLEHLGLTALPAGDLRVVLNVCEHTPPEIVICSDFFWAREVAEEHPRVPVVVATTQRLDNQTLLEALRAGVSDVWYLPMTTVEIEQGLRRIRTRVAAAAAESERQLNQFIADLERDQRAGRYIQMGMLPPNPMAIERFRFQHRIYPSLILSGDFVDYFRITDRHFAFYIADVAGHGASSAFVTVLLKNFSRRLRREHRRSMLTAPGEVLEWVNRELIEQKIDKHVAIMLGIGDLDTDRVHLVNGGHYPPAIRVGREGAAFVEQRGKPVGLFDKVSYEPRSFVFEPGERLVMFSDGVIDAMGAGDLATKEQRLLDAVVQANDVDDMWALLDVDIRVRSKPDDITCLTVQREY